MPVPLDSLTITFLARDLDRLIQGREIKGVAIGEDKVLTISLGDGALRFLYEPSFPLLWAAEPARVSGLPAPRFEEALLACQITRVEQVGLERVIRMEAESLAGNRRHPQGGAGESKHCERISFRLYFELGPPFPNLFLADHHDTILAVLLRAGTKTKRRTLEQGKPYLAPAAQAKRHPFELAASEIEALARQGDDEALAKAVLGVGPFLAKDLAGRAREQGSLAAAYAKMIDAYRNSQISPCIFSVSTRLAKHPPRIGLAWYRPAMDGVSDVRPMPTVNAAAGAAARAFMRTSAFERRKASLERALAKEIDRWTAMRHDGEKARRGKEKASELRRWGELITAHLARIKKGQTEVSLPDIYSEAAHPVVVPLEPHLTPHGNADAYFKQARKAERSAHMAEETIRGAKRRLAELEAWLHEVEGASEAKESAKTAFTRLGEIAAQLGRARTTAKEKAEEVDARAATLGIRPRRFVVADGWAVLVGRSAAENDVLTHKYASPSDLWFHARQAQGSHVVLRRDRKKTEPSRQAILEAARLAAYYSKAKNSKHVPVSYAEKRYVKKVRRGAPGLAAMLREKVVYVTPTPPKDAAE
jgi:predicted ribosome quality control (RQC) complex YloA/Tae2 family protein